MIHTLAEEFTREVQLLCATPVSDQDWQAFLDTHIPQVAPSGQPLAGRASTHAARKRAVLQQLWTNDPQSAPGPAPPTASYKRSTPTSTMRASCAELTGLNATTSRPSPTAIATWTEPPCTH